MKFYGHASPHDASLFHRLRSAWMAFSKPRPQTQAIIAQAIKTANSGIPGFVLDPDLKLDYNQSQPPYDQIYVLIQLLRNLAKITPGRVARFHFLPLSRITMGLYKIGDNQYQDVAVAPVDAAGLPTTDPNPLQFTSSDTTIAVVQGPALDASGTAIPNSVRVAAAQPPKLGTVNINVTDGTNNGVFQVEVDGGPVVGFNDSPLGTPQNLP